MTTPDDLEATAYERNVEIITKATAQLLQEFGPKGFSPLAIFEGCVKGGAVALICGTGIEIEEAATLLEDIAEAMRAPCPDDPKPMAIQ